MEAVELSRRELSAQIDKIAQHAAAKRTRQEQAAYFERAALAVIEVWARIRQLEPVASSNPDPDPTKRSQRLTYSLIDWIADIELATEKALADRPDLQSVWFAIALEKPVNMRQRNETLQKCGRIYAGLGLEPWKYWRRSTR